MLLHLSSLQPSCCAPCWHPKWLLLHLFSLSCQKPKNHLLQSLSEQFLGAGSANPECSISSRWRHSHPHSQHMVTVGVSATKAAALWSHGASHHRSSRGITGRKSLLWPLLLPLTGLPEQAITSLLSRDCLGRLGWFCFIKTWRFQETSVANPIPQTHCSWEPLGCSTSAAWAWCLLNGWCRRHPQPWLPRGCPDCFSMLSPCLQLGIYSRSRC